MLKDIADDLDTQKSRHKQIKISKVILKAAKTSAVREHDWNADQIEDNLRLYEII